MIIYRASNTPIIMSFDIALTDIPHMEFALYSDNNAPCLIDSWTKDDLIIQETYAAIPLTQKQTRLYPAGIGHMEIKWLDDNGFVLFSTSTTVYIKTVQNLSVLGDDDEIDYTNISLSALATSDVINRNGVTSIVTNIATVNTCQCVPDEALNIIEIMGALD